MRVDPASPALVVNPRLDRGLRRLLLLGLAAVLLLPAARGYNPWLGWMPLWLLGMPLAGWWALHRCRLPPWPQRLRAGAVVRRRRGKAQARRRSPQPIGLARAA